MQRLNPIPNILILQLFRLQQYRWYLGIYRKEKKKIENRENFGTRSLNKTHFLERNIEDMLELLNLPVLNDKNKVLELSRSKLNIEIGEKGYILSHLFLGS